jgi:hypothetical protein
MKYYNVRVDKDKEISVYLRLTDEDVKHIQEREQGTGSVVRVEEFIDRDE